MIMDPVPCPKCGSTLDAITAVSADDPPQAGDATVCFQCAATLIFEAAGGLRLPTDEEAAVLWREPEIARVKAAIIRGARARGRDLK